MTPTDLSAAERLFNQGKYFEAHDALEEIWNHATGARKTCLQGLIQLCAAYHKLSVDGVKAPGAPYLLERGREKISANSGELPPGAAESIVAAIDRALEALSRGEFPKPPRLFLR